MSGNDKDSLTDTEKKLLLQFRSRFAPEELHERITTDYFLVQWIRKAKNNNLDKAEELLRKTLSWRREQNVDDILSWEVPSDLQKWSPSSYIGFDIDNRPIGFGSLGQTNYRKIIQMKQDDLFIKRSIQILERALELGQGKCMRNGEPVHQMVTIIDFKGLSLLTVLNKRAIHMLTESLLQAETNYPNIVHKIYIINAVLPASLTDVMEAINSPAKWKSVFEETIAPDVVSKIVNSK